MPPPHLEKQVMLREDRYQRMVSMVTSNGVWDRQSLLAGGKSELYAEV